MDQIKAYYKIWRELPQPRKIKFIMLMAFACYSFSLFLLVIYAFGRTGKRTSTIVPTVLFTDGAPYNLEVIRYLAQRRDVIISMVVLNNNSLSVERLRSNVENVKTMLTALNAEGYAKTVPVYLPQTSSSANFAPALDQMVSKQSMKFVVVGPCTEAAYFLREYPARRSNVANIFVAGGAFNSAGNANYLLATNTRAERNFFLDPSAADYVVTASHGRPVTLFPIDATFPWTEEAYTSIVSKPSSPSTSAGAVATGLQWYYRDVDGTRSTTVGLMAVAYASDAQVQQTAVYTSIPVRVKKDQTDAVNGESYRPSSGNSVRVILRVAADTFFSHLLRVNELALV
ncbi:hypothetical protein JKF63_04063 [Porcisia hertigi]|uniref:Inosine/uridine-preferring nucleoside hydrolase domain-containing protein n=1 Tax=Porcisia hertigi TaxID=2761500 RepID=A0A836HYZ2_9TRYP|nr:hypothetical protein JKF63_04063 [Porcisia hertigi]